MAQSRYFEFGADDTTLSLNASNVGVVKGGVYAGFDAVQLFNAPTPPSTFNVQIRHTGSGVSYTNPQGVTKSPIGILVTNQGAKIWEDAPINVAIPENIDGSYAIVAQHNYQAISGGIQAVYLAIQGTITSDMVKIGELTVVQNGGSYDLTWERERSPFIKDILNDVYFDTETKFAEEVSIEAGSGGIGKLDFGSNYAKLIGSGNLTHIQKPKKWDFPNNTSVSSSYFVRLSSNITINNDNINTIEGFAPISTTKFPRGGALNLFEGGSVLEFVYFDGVWWLINEFNPNFRNYYKCQVNNNSNYIENNGIIASVYEVDVLSGVDTVVMYLRTTNTVLNKVVTFIFNAPLGAKLFAHRSALQDAFGSSSGQDEYYDLRYPIQAFMCEDGLTVISGVKITPTGSFTSVTTWIGTIPTHSVRYRANGDYIEFEGRLEALKGQSYVFKIPASLFEGSINSTSVVSVRETVDKPNLGTGYEVSYQTNGSFVEFSINGNDPTSTVAQINYNFNNLRIRRK